MKLTKGMKAALELMVSKSRPISYYEARDVGSSGIALSRLCDLGLAYAEGLKHGQVWHIRAAGRAALEEQPS
jgi:hypothetical protein